MKHFPFYVLAIVAAVLLTGIVFIQLSQGQFGQAVSVWTTPTKPGPSTTTYPGIFAIDADTLSLSLVIGNQGKSTDVLAAMNIMTKLQEQFPQTPPVTKLFTEYTGGNVIAIGSPCDNPLVAQITGITACDFNLQEGQGYIGFYRQGGQINAVITGATEQDIVLASAGLSKLTKLNINSRPALIVEGTIQQPQYRKP